MFKFKLAPLGMGYARVLKGTCFKCKKKVLCLEVDTSDGEYTELCLCLNCINKEFEEYKGEER